MEEFMATRTQDRQRDEDRSGLFNWKTGGVLAAGAALAIGANIGRKLFVQGMSGAAGDWDDSLAAEHDAVTALFDKMLETDDSNTVIRRTLLAQIAHALDKHAYAEEHVVYARLRESGDKAFAEHLENDHGAVKEFIYRLMRMEADDPAWIETVTAFRDAVVLHAEEEEDQIFPALRAKLSEEENAQLTKDVNKAGWSAR
jgi:hemerythrin superfamily protein